MKRSSLARRTPLRKVNPERAARKWERNFGAHRAFIVALPCLVCGRQPVDPAHLDARGMGGCGGDASVLVPLCRAHHGQQEGRTDAFSGEVGIDLRAVAAVLWAAGEVFRAAFGQELEGKLIDLWRLIAAQEVDGMRTAIVFKGNRDEVLAAWGVLASQEVGHE